MAVFKRFLRETFAKLPKEKFLRLKYIKQMNDIQEWQSAEKPDRINNKYTETYRYERNC